jgi:hypothetical protein
MKFHKNTDKAGFKCDVCKASFDRKEKLERHLKSNHPEGKAVDVKDVVRNINDVDDVAKDVKDIVTNVYDDDNVKAVDKDVVKVAVKNVVQDVVQNVVQDDVEGVVQDVDNDLVKNIYNDVTKDFNSVERENCQSSKTPAKCPICSLSFVKKCNLNAHLKIVHENAKYFHCNFCQKTIKLKN